MYCTVFVIVYYNFVTYPYSIAMLAKNAAQLSFLRKQVGLYVTVQYIVR